ncbi:MAG: Mut7-C RNAse domain-containing protein [Candidatus Methanomethylicaceae archaeon]
MQFLADAMLGKLARWLRIIGHDTAYDPSLDDGAMIFKAKSESRVLVTRDLELSQRARREGVESTLIISHLLAQELEEMLPLLGIGRAGSRCPLCNTALTEADRAMQIEKAPGNARLWLCPSCGKTYWHGSHWKGIRTTLESLGLSDANDLT